MLISEEKLNETQEYDTGSLVPASYSSSTFITLYSGATWANGSGNLSQYSLHLPGSPAFAEIPSGTSFAALNSGTILCWCNPDNWTVNNRVISQEGPSNVDGWTFVQLGVTPQMSFITRSGATATSSQVIGNIPIGSWSHMAVAFTNSGAGHSRVYLNGDFVTEDTTSYMGSTSITTHIGKRSNANATYFGGQFDELLIYDRMLTDQEINDVYNGKKVRKGVLAYYKLEEGSGATSQNNVGGVVSHYTLPINGEIEAIKVKGLIGSLWVRESGLKQDILINPSGAEATFSAYPITYGVTNKNVTGSPHIAYPLIVNSPLEIVGSIAGILDNVKVVYT